MRTPRCIWHVVILVAAINTLPILPGNAQHAHAADVCAWAGIYPTVLTPYCDSGGIDTRSLECQLRFELSGGVHGLLVLGTIGEGQYTSMDERAQVIATAVRVACQAVPVVVGIHTCNLDDARAQMVQACTLGASAVLVKYLGNPTASGPEVLGFYAALCDLHILPILYYHYPSQTKLRLKPEEVAAIVSLPGVVGIKESTLNLRAVKAHICLTRGQGKVFLSGTALNLTQFMDLGGHGVMCPEAVLLPAPTVQAYVAYVSGRHGEARRIQAHLFYMTPILRSGGLPPAVNRAILMCAEDHLVPMPIGHDQPQARLKAALNCVGCPTSVSVKCPLPPLTPADEQRVNKTMARLRSIDWCEAALDAGPLPMEAAWRDQDENDQTQTKSSSPSEYQRMFLKMGPFQLGPGGGGRNLWRTQGDGLGGF
jgi:4-hydroxy-tetrahydrodipicolinate synthase